MTPNRVVLGRIAVPFGIRGWVKVQPFSEDPLALAGHPAWDVGRDGSFRSYEVESVREHGALLIAKLAGIEDRDAAFGLKGQDVAVAREALPPPAEGEYYWSDLLGLTAVKPDGTPLGRVVQMMETGAHDVLVIEGTKTHLVPFVSAYVGTVDLEGGTLVVDWDESW